MKTVILAVSALAVAATVGGCGRPASQLSKSMARDAAEAAAKARDAGARQVPTRPRTVDPGVRRRPTIGDRAEGFAAARVEDGVKDVIEDTVEDQFD